MTRTKRFLVVLPVVLAAVLCVMIIGAPRVHAAGYREITYTDTTPVKVGSFYFKYSSNFYYSTDKDTGYVSLGYGKVATNGTKAVYVSSGSLVSLDLKSGTVTNLKKLPTGNRSFEDDSWSVSVAKGNQVFLIRGSFEKWTYWTYIYNVKNKTFKKVLSKCALGARYGKYVVGTNEYQSDVSAHKMTLYKIANGKLKKVKVLTKYGFAAVFIGKKLYYTSSNNSSMRKTTLYRCNANGSKKKKLGTFKGKGEYGQAVVNSNDITKKNCVVYLGDGSYLYTYKTKKLVKQ